MIAIVMRCHNRLEYTIRALDMLRKNNLHGPEYRVIVVDNNSADGTHEWFNWVLTHEDPKRWFLGNKSQYMRLNENLGDWKGMLEGFKCLNDYDKYVCQLDNDIIVGQDGLAQTKALIDQGIAKVAMLKRKGYVKEILPSRPGKFNVTGIGNMNLAAIPLAVSYYITDVTNVKIASKFTNCRDWTGKIGKIYKVLDNYSEQMDGHGNYGYKIYGNRYLQFEKYPQKNWDK